MRPGPSRLCFAWALMVMGGLVLAVLFRLGPIPTRPASTVRPTSLKAADFQRALGTRPVSRTAHFVLHALPLPVRQGGPAAGALVSADRALPAELSTSDAVAEGGLVDDFTETLSDPGQAKGLAGFQSWRFGLVLPKKQAKRSVTRNLIRHQAREALRRHAPAVLAEGGHQVEGWVLRLRAPFDRKQFPSAASDALKAVVRLELDELWARLAVPSASSAPSGKGGRKPSEKAVSAQAAGGMPRGAA